MDERATRAGKRQGCQGDDARQRLRDAEGQDRAAYRAHGVSSGSSAALAVKSASIRGEYITQPRGMAGASGHGV